MKSERARAGSHGSGTAQLSMISLDLSSVSEALELAKKLAIKTGRTITVRNADGEILGILRGAAIN
jgi:hypothetical protein